MKEEPRKTHIGELWTLEHFIHEVRRAITILNTFSIVWMIVIFQTLVMFINKVCV